MALLYRAGRRSWETNILSREQTERTILKDSEHTKPFVFILKSFIEKICAARDTYQY